MNTIKIGWIGLGTMGIPMSQNLLKAGYPVSVYNRSKNKAEGMKSMGFQVGSSPQELILKSDVIIIMVTDDKAIDDIFNGPVGLATANVSGKMIINMSTVSPAISKEMDVLSRSLGNNYLDAPVSGSVKQAVDGQLVIMVGGDQPSFEKVKPILSCLGKLVMKMGEIGSGNSTKIVMNTLLALYAQGLAEAVLFARSQNIRIEDLMTLINNSALSNVFTKLKGEIIISENYHPAFALMHVAKDLRLAKNLGSSSPISKVVFETFQEAEPNYGEEDIISVIKQLSGAK
jgi:3-hydroxyisobutyrate dehydrogenase